MGAWFEHVDLTIALLVFGLGILAFVISTLSGGGGALLLIPCINFLLGASKTAPIVNLGTFIGRPVRLLIFWKHIVWKLVLYYTPAAITGSILAAWVFTEVKLAWLQLIVALFLISTLFQYQFGKKKQSFKVKKWHFIPLGFFIAAISTFTGGMGPVLNPFYLNAGITKERLIATKTVNSFLVGIIQISSYTFFGLLYKELWVYGIILGLGAALGNVIGKHFLKTMSDTRFRRWVIALMVVSGLAMVIELGMAYV